jgi:hypothetical protein
MKRKLSIVILALLTVLAAIAWRPVVPLDISLKLLMGSGGSGSTPTNTILREDGTFMLREDGSYLLRE